MFHDNAVRLRVVPVGNLQIIYQGQCEECYSMCRIGRQIDDTDRTLPNLDKA